MSEGSSGPVGATRHDQEHQPTDNTSVDEVVRSLEQLEGSPVTEHVRVFEDAHERLRGALADAGNDNAGS